MKRTLALLLTSAMLFTAAPAQAGTGVTKSGCIAIDREWLTVTQKLAGVEALYKIPEVAASLQHAATVWSKASTQVQAKGGTKVATALTTAATAARTLRTKLLKSDAKGTIALSVTMGKAMEKTILPACAALF